MRRLFVILGVLGLGLLACRIPDLVPPRADGGSDAGDAGISCGSAIDCEDFEDAAWGSYWNRPQSVAGGKLEIDRAKGHRGTSSLHVSAFAFPDGGDTNVTLAHIPFTARDFYLRFFLFAPSVPNPPAIGEGLVSLSSQEGSSGLSLIRYEQLAVATYGPKSTVPTGFEAVGTSAMLSSPDAWDCVELHVSMDGAGAPHLGLWLRDQEYTVPSFQYPINIVAGGVLELGILTALPAQVAYELWIDDIIIDTQRVGCAR